MSEPVYRERDFRLFLGVRIVATLAVMIQSVAIGWQVYDLERTPLALAWVGLAGFIPMFLLTLPAGAVVDHTDQRKVLCAAFLIQAVAAGLLLALSMARVHVAWPFYMVAAVFGIARAFYGPAAQSLLAFLVPPERLARSIALSGSANQAAVIVGPALGGIIYSVGPAPTYGTCLVAFCLASAAAALYGGRRKRPPAQAQLAPVARVREGLAFVFSRPVILGAISLDLFAVLLGGATALLPVYARDILHVGPTGLGALRSATAIGATCTALALARSPLSRDTGRRMFAAVAVFGVATILFGVSRNMYLSLGALIILGAADQISVFVRSSLIQLATPDAMRGRVSAVSMLFIGTSNELGEFESGATAALLGTVPAVVLGGVGTLLVVGVWMRLFPALRTVDRLDSLLPPGEGVA
ncbi:MAG TPA: MFS transporter [Steroidobacteraceae bacterium]|nr:MFS transporter [Steroidobacteraceae bacterium]